MGTGVSFPGVKTAKLLANQPLTFVLCRRWECVKT